jgi:predicted small metal-binding protein
MSRLCGRSHFGAAKAHCPAAGFTPAPKVFVTKIPYQTEYIIAMGCCQNHFVACGKTEEDVMRQASEHAKKDHHMNEIPKDLQDKARSVIRDIESC